MGKSYVSLERQICIVCGKSFNTGGLLIDKRLKASMKKYTNTGMGMCPHDEQRKKDGYIGLIGCFNSVGKDGSKEERLTSSKAKRSGRVVHLKILAFKRIICVPTPENSVCFIEDEGIDKILGLVKQEGSQS